ncbi:MAG TPA: FHA domain-containing protein [Kofleriaceae bacterium]
MLPHAWEPLAPLLALEQRASGNPPTRALVDTLTASLLGVGRSKAPWPLLRAVYRGRDYPVIRAPFVIGRSAVCDLAIDGDGVADEHAAVVLLDDAVYLKDLGSPAGVVYRGRRIGHKRIDEGDVFDICGHEISFTFRT